MPKPADQITAFVDGKRVKRIYVLMRHPMFLITEDAGTHETSRVFVTEEGCRIGDRLNGKLGPATVQAVYFDRQGGLTLVTSRGNVFSPAQDCQVTWVP